LPEVTRAAWEVQRADFSRNPWPPSSKAFGRWGRKKTQSTSKAALSSFNPAVEPAQPVPAEGKLTRAGSGRGTFGQRWLVPLHPPRPRQEHPCAQHPPGASSRTLPSPWLIAMGGPAPSSPPQDSLDKAQGVLADVD